MKLTAQESEDGSAPAYSDTGDLSSHLGLAAGTIINQTCTQIENVVDAWGDEADLGVRGNDTSTSYRDSRMGSTDLGPNVLGGAYTMRHGFFWDGRIVKATSDSNDNDNDYQRDHTEAALQ